MTSSKAHLATATSCPPWVRLPSTPREFFLSSRTSTIKRREDTTLDSLCKASLLSWQWMISSLSNLIATLHYFVGRTTKRFGLSFLRKPGQNFTRDITTPVLVVSMKPLQCWQALRRWVWAQDCRENSSGTSCTTTQRTCSTSLQRRSR